MGLLAALLASLFLFWGIDYGDVRVMVVRQSGNQLHGTRNANSFGASYFDVSATFAEYSEGKIKFWDGRGGREFFFSFW